MVAATGAVVAGAVAGAVTAGVMVVHLAGCLLDWQPASKRTASAKISDPHDHRVRRFAWFIGFLFVFGIWMTGELLQLQPFNSKRKSF
ncbi:MAG: hypothetical protein WBN22_02870 [Verrucomicrobiia bacterium]